MTSNLITVTGSEGFIGGRLVRALQGGGSLLAVDHPLAHWKRDNRVFSVPFKDHDRFLHELSSRRLCPSLIVHLGACSSTTEISWDYLRTNNLEYSKSLWNWCADANVRFIYASSAATYGDGSSGFDDDSPLSHLEPLNLYGRSKHEFDLWIEEQVRSGAKLPAQCVGFKFFNVFGPGEAHKGRMASMVFHAYHQIKRTGRVRLFASDRHDYEDGGQLRDFIYVDQVVDVILQCVRIPGINGLFNLGTGKARSFKDLALAVFAALGLPPQIEYIPMPGDLQGKYQYFTQATMAKAARAGLVLPELSLEGAVRRYVEWLEARPVEVPAVAA